MSSPTEPGFQPVVFPCARCGHPAAIFSLFPAESGEGMWRERDYQAIRSAAGPDLIAFHCWECDADYCEACWRIGPPEFDEDFPGFYDCTEGICPAGHIQVVDD